MNFQQLIHNDDGQSLVEYALVLLLVAVVAFAAVSATGHQIKNALTEVTLLFSGSAIRTVEVGRTGHGHGNDVVITVTVGQAATLTAADSQSGKSVTQSCSATCVLTITGVGHQAGTISVTDGSGTATAAYPAKS